MLTHTQIHTYHASARPTHTHMHSHTRVFVLSSILMLSLSLSKPFLFLSSSPHLPSLLCHAPPPQCRPLGCVAGEIEQLEMAAVTSPPRGGGGGWQCGVGEGHWLAQRGGSAEGVRVTGWHSGATGLERGSCPPLLPKCSPEEGRGGQQVGAVVRQLCAQGVELGRAL